MPLSTHFSQVVALSSTALFVTHDVTLEAQFTWARFQILYVHVVFIGIAFRTSLIGMLLALYLIVFCACKGCSCSARGSHGQGRCSAPLVGSSHPDVTHTLFCGLVLCVLSWFLAPSSLMSSRLRYPPFCGVPRAFHSMYCTMHFACVHRCSPLA